MSLDFNYKDCDDSLLTDEHYSATCEFVVFQTMFVGMPQITRDNVEQFAMRILLFNAASGGIFSPHTSSEVLDKVLPWVGLRTNASHMTDAAFYKKLRHETSEQTMRYMRMAVSQQGRTEMSGA